MKRALRIPAALAALLLAAPSPARTAADASGSHGTEQFVAAAYDFYIGGLPIAEIQFRGSLASDGYDAQSSVVTRGILEVLLNARVNARARGVRHDYGHLTPKAYATRYRTRGDSRAIRIGYADQTPTRVSIEPPESPKPYDTDPTLHGGALDPVTAAVTMMTPGDSASLCNRTIPVFDGKRRYDIVLLPLERRPAGESPPSPAWPSPLIRCFGVYERIAGFEPKLQTAQRYYPFDIWFEDDGDDSVFTPVRIAGKTRLGFAIGNLRP